MAEVGILLRLNVLDTDHRAALAAALAGYSRCNADLDTVVDRWAELRTTSRSTTRRNDRERRQNDMWLAACAMSVADPPAIVTADLSDLLPIARQRSCILTSSKATPSACSGGGSAFEEAVPGFDGVGE